jgi:periplasmic protein TonB
MAHGRKIMSDTVAVRATSLLGSAGLLGAAVIVALTFTYTLPMLNVPPFERPPVTVETPPLPPRPPETIRRPIVPPPIEGPTEITDLTPIAPLTDPPTNIGDYGPPGPAALQTITQPHWVRQPRDLQAYYPRRALRLGVEGSVVLDCVVGTTGYLRCGVASESPANWGFGEAALRIAADHRMTPAMRDGTPVEGRYRMRVPFRVE